jgi:hypothetical protein
MGTGAAAWCGLDADLEIASDRAGTLLIGQRTSLPSVTSVQPRVVLCSMITPLAATRKLAWDW